MKKIYILLVALFLVNLAVGQSCLPEGITFTTQAQIDNFHTNYPNCTEIEGNVTLAGGDDSDITNLNGLSALTSVGGDLIFSWTPDLNDLSGLEALTYIGGNLTFSDSHVASLTGLNALTTIAGNFHIVYHHGILTSLSGLDSLTSIGGDVSIGSADYLTNLTGLGSLTTIGGLLGLGPNSAMTTLSGLEALSSIGGPMIILANQSLESLAGLDALTSIGGFLFIQYNDSLMNLTDLDEVNSIGGYLNILNNDALTSLAGLDNIAASSIDSLFITENNSLTTCAIKSVCDYIANATGYIEIHDNATGCNSKGEVETDCGLSVENLTINGGLLILPNPTSTSITIETPAKGSLTILNLSGQKILQQQITEPTTTIDVSGWKSGVYFLRVTSDRTVMTGKFIKQ